MKTEKKKGSRTSSTRPATEKSSRGFTKEERAAMRDRIREMRGGQETEGEGAVLAKIAALPPSDRALAERVHAIIRASAPTLGSRTWYGMPAYTKDGNVVCFFQSGQKFKARYASLGFTDKAKLDEGRMWPTTYALKELTAAEEARIGELVRKAVS